MRTQLITASAVVLLSAAGATANSRPAARLENQQPAVTQPATAQRPLTGTWRSAPDEMKLTSDFDKSVWGPNATSVRTVELVVKSNNDATLRVVKRVVDAKRRTVPASTWIEEAQLRIGGATPGVADRIEHEVTVTGAVRLFPDDADYRFTIDGLRVKIVTFTARDGNSLEVRYDTPEGRGSFWETLTRARPAAPRTAKPGTSTGS
jgi:hypothetical protein